MKRVLFSLFCVSAFAGSANAGEILRPTLGAEFTWQSTTCLKPRKPRVDVSTPSGQMQIQAYASKISYYIDCLKREAQADFDRAQIEMQRAIEKELQARTDEMNDEIQNAARGR